MTRLARRPPSSTPGPAGGPGRCAPLAFCIWSRGLGRPQRRAGERTSERGSRRLRLPFAHFLDSRHDPLDIIFGPAPGLGSNRPARHGSGGEREAGGARPPGPARAPRRPHSRPPARSLTHTHRHSHTHSHTYTHTHKAWCRRAPRAQCASAGRQLHGAGGAAPPRQPAVRPPGAAAAGQRYEPFRPPGGGARDPLLPGEAAKGTWRPPAPVTLGQWDGRARGHLLGGRRCRGSPGESGRGGGAFLGSQRGGVSAAPVCGSGCNNASFLRGSRLLRVEGSDSGSEVLLERVERCGPLPSRDAQARTSRLLSSSCWKTRMGGKVPGVTTKDIQPCLLNSFRHRKSLMIFISIFTGALRPFPPVISCPHYK